MPGSTSAFKITLKNGEQSAARKCFVVHRDRISDLAGWRKRPDRFYFNRLFDPWIRKEFDVIPATTVTNLPAHIRDVLISRYEYVVAEREVVPDLTDTIRLCDTCEKWCPPAETVQCDRCKKFFHMGCVNPPLLAKPSRGYGWTAQAEDKRACRERARTARKDRTLAEKEENVEIKHFKMWPFRYFGRTLDPDDLIFPRAATRVGPKYQATVPAAPGTENAYIAGGDSTIEVLSLVNKMSTAEVETLEAYKLTLTRNEKLRSSVDWLTEVTFRLTEAWSNRRDFHTVNMRSPMRLEKFKKSETRYTDREWSNEEIAAFEDAIAVHGAELRPVRDEVGTRSMPEVVRFYGHWKNSKLREETSGSGPRDSGTDEKIKAPSRAVSPDEEGSVVKEPGKGNTSCGACRTRESDVWWKAPKGLPTNVLCDNCGLSWRKYADLNIRPMREETLVKKSGDKREGTPLNGPSAKRAKTTSSVQSTPPPAGPSAPQLRCVACQKNGPTGKVLRCRQCQFRVHAGACGVIVDPATVESWVCDLCQNEKTLEASLISDCLLCPRMRRDPKKKMIYPPPDSFLRACKPTEGQAWVHVLCSVFIPEVMYSDSSRLRLVEGISAIPQYRWSNKCTLCDRDDGAVIQCSECPAEYHVSCALKHGHKFGFEIQGVKASKRDTTTIVEFKDRTGQMVPVVICKGHVSHRRTLYDLCDTNEFGETALQVYCKNYKQAPTAHIHGLLRKARRLDKILNTHTPDGSAASSVDGDAQASAEPHCYRCKTEFSPLFYPATAQGAQAWLCHKCHAETRESHPVTNGIGSS
ncbi:Lid2 complex component snt2 [Grifola frondosa]|uniref:Lid2 complex component snt2 n=1 Tax=Grifola frondosa TaxID=5627 RepID=A0A1C7M9R4_GRIFR|nr:Lid2 complex component snt2 [Grifola frondosa]